ncbi:MAG: SDR family NAD(P)-dependent oxidoreductase, partial [Chloroflexota bacterium]
MLLEEKKALITGGRKGIGRGVAARLAEEGADVGIADVLADEEAERTAERVRSHGRRATIHRADVSRVTEIDTLIDAFVSEHGRVDIIMNGAIYPDHTVPLLETEEAHWDNMMNLSLKGYFFASKRAAQRMVEQEPMPGHPHAARGRIINIASVHGYA